MAEHSAEARYAGRIGRHAVVYGIAALMTLISGLASVVFYTRYLDPTEYGQVAVLLSISAFVTVIANLGSLQGTMRRVFGSAGDEGGGDVDTFDSEHLAGDPRMAMATGFAVTALVGVLLVLVSWPLTGFLSNLLIDSSQDPNLFLYAVGAGAAAAIMRLGRNMVRLQLRSGAYLAITTVFAIGSTAFALPLLIAGGGVEAVMIGTITANLLAAGLAIVYLRRDIRMAASFREGIEIMRGGVGYLPLILSFQTIQIADTLLVAGIADLRSAGLYRVAQRVGQPVSYGTSVFQQAWAPMRRDLTQLAVAAKDDDRKITAQLVTYYAVFVTAVILTVAVFATVLVKLAAPEFDAAAALVPLTAVSVAGHGCFVLAYRTSQLPNSWALLRIFAMLAAVLFVGSAAILVGLVGAVGAAIAAIIAWTVAALGILILNQKKGKPIPFEYGKLAAVLGSAVVVGLVSSLLVPDDALGFGIRVVLLGSWLGGLVWFDLVPRRALRSLASFAADARRTESSRKLRAGVRSLEGTGRELIDELLVYGEDVGTVAKRHGLSEAEIFEATIQALREASGGGAPHASDPELGSAILIPRPDAERKLKLFEIVSEGADPIEVDRIVRTAAAARKISKPDAQPRS